MTTQSSPKIILFDIETAMNKGYFFDLFNKIPMPYDAIERERYMICAAWKELGSKKIHKVDVLDGANGDPQDDRYVVETLREALIDADAVVAHYGDKFDLPWLNTRMVYWGLDPLPNLIQIDTFKIAKSKFRFNANRLDYLGEFLRVGRKIKTDRDLWYDCMEGKVSAINKMVKYNKQDVELLEKVYTKLAPFVPSKVNMANFTDTDCCPLCGSEDYQRRGYAHTRTMTYQRYQCNECGHWFRSGKSEPRTAEGGHR